MKAGHPGEGDADRRRRAIPEPPLYFQASLETEADMKEADAEARRALGMDQGVDPISFDANGVAELTRAGGRAST